MVRQLRQLLGRRLAGVVGDCGFTSHAALAALLALGVPFLLGFGRSAPIQARLAALSRQQRQALRLGGAIRLGPCPWDARLRLFALGARTPTDHRGPWVYVTSLRSYGPQRLASLYRRRGRVEQTIDELCNGHDLDHLVSYRLHPNRVALGFRLLARTLALGLQLTVADQSPTVLREPRACRTTHVQGVGTFTAERRTIHLHARRPGSHQCFRLGWTHRVERLAA